MSLAALRKAAGLSQKEVAVALGTHHSAVSNWETGRSQPSVQLVNSLASLYGVTAKEIYDEAEGVDRWKEVSNLCLRNALELLSADDHNDMENITKAHELVSMARDLEDIGSGHRQWMNTSGTLAGEVEC